MAEEEPFDDVRPAKRPRVLVACQRCKGRRQKCDNSSPACSNCQKANVPCIYSNQAYPSSYVKRLEERVRQLEGNLAANIRDDPQVPIAEAATPAQFASPASTRSQETMGEASGGPRPGDRFALGLGVLSSCAAAEPHYFGFSAGLSLAHFVQAAIDSGGNSADVSLPLLADRPFSNQAPRGNASLADPPTFKVGAGYLKAYLTLVHPLYPFLNQQRLWQWHRSITKHKGKQGVRNVERIDLTMIHLVYAIGSRCLQLLGRHSISNSVPEGHFLRAMENINQDLKFTSTKSIEVTLLLAIHSMRSPYGTSVWHLAGLAIRQCLELGLHKQRVVDRQNTEADQYRKRLFWSAYIFERKTALVLGRPFALSDEEVDLDLPANMNDSEDEVAVENMRPDSLSQQPQQKTPLSFHRYHVQLYQIHSQIRLALYQIKKIASKEQVRLKISGLLEQLDHWKHQVIETFHETVAERLNTSQLSTRSSEDQESGESETSSSEDVHRQQAINRPVEVEKNELLLEYHKARRSLLQPLMTESRHNYPFGVADYAACAEASGQICQLYRRLHRLSPVPFTLRDLHAVFVAGFTLIYCVCTCPVIYSVERVSDVGACLTVLYVITEQWSSAKKYRDAFETIADRMMDSAKRYQHGNPILPTMLTRQHHNLSSSRRANNVVNPIRPGSRQPQGSHESESYVYTASSPLRSTIDANMGDPQSHDASLARVSGDGSAQPLSPLSSSTPGFLSLPLGIRPYNDSTHLVTTGHQIMGLDLDPDISDIERLLSNEGLDWFTGAVF